MCSLGDDNYEEFESNSKVMLPEEKLISRKCNKCRNDSSCVLLRNKDSYCKECFLSGATHKFKASLGKHRLIRPDDKVLIHHKLGHPSAALLHFIKSGINLDTHKKLRFRSVFVFVEQNWKSDLVSRRSILKSVETQVKELDFEIYYASLAEFIRNRNNTECLINKDASLIALKDSDKVVLEAVLQKKANTSSKNDLLNIYRRELLIHAAKNLGCKFIFSPEIATDVSSQLLTNISLGRGCHIPLDTGFADTRDPKVSILRPLRNFELKELAFYNFYCNVPVVNTLPDTINPFASVQSLMQKFVSDLNVSFPATVTTILKTGDKLDLSDTSLSEGVCSLCKGPLENLTDDLSSGESTKFSHWVSTRSQSSTLSGRDRYEELLRGFQNDECNKYCYSCEKLALLM